MCRQGGAAVFGRRCAVVGRRAAMTALTPERRRNLRRLLAPRHIAFIGGADADYSAGQCALGFNGPIWGVNPKRRQMGGQPCFATVADLPAAPDAVFLATPRSATLPILRQLNARGAGGVACFTAGYGELGAAGKQAEQELAQAAGDLALVGPNSYGVINYLDAATLWPFGAGSRRCARGIALLMQSGMITADMAMNQRSVPLAYVISTGNQAVLAIEDYLDVLVDEPRITAFGLYIEGIVNVERFAAAGLKALAAGKPIVLLKAGSSTVGAQLAVSHTGSISGADEAHQALFDRLGMLRVHSPELLLETLKWVTVSGVPSGRRVVAFTCSGGEALMAADYCDRIGLELSPFSAAVQAELRQLLPEIATVSNPLDYTTPLWGNTEVMPKVFAAALKDPFDAAVFIQDYPPAEFNADNTHYRSDGKSYIAAVAQAGIPAAICSELAENIDRQSREIMLAGGVTPLQGFDRGFDAIALSCRYHENRQRILAESAGQFTLVEAARSAAPVGRGARRLNEWESKQALQRHGVATPGGRLVAVDDAPQAVAAAVELGFPVAVKLVGEQVAHKTELGAVRLGLYTPQQVENAVAEMQPIAARILDRPAGILVEPMVTGVVHELLVGVRRDPQFGLVMTIAGGGILVELHRDATTLLLPTERETIIHALSRLRCFPLLCGFRGRPKCDLERIGDAILQLAIVAETVAPNLIEMEVNPLMLRQQDAVAADALITMADGNIDVKN